MNTNYEQLNTASPENLSNPFSHSKRSHNKFSEIIRTKNKFSRCIIPFVVILLIIFFNSIQKSRTKVLEELQLENSSLKEEILSLQTKEHDLNQVYKQFRTEKQTLTKQRDELTASIQQFTEKNEQLEHTSSEGKELADELNAQLEQIENKLQSVSQENDDISKRIENADNDDYSEEIYDLKDKIDDLKSKIAKLKQNGNKYEDDYLDIDSQIITTPSEVALLKKWININQNYKFELLYRATKHGYSNEKFKQYVQDTRGTVVLLKDRRKNTILGGFTTQSWVGEGFKEDRDAFVFNLSAKAMYGVRDYSKAIYCSEEYAAVFGKGDIVTRTKEAYTSFPQSYGTGKEEYNLLGMDGEKIELMEMEVFQLVGV